MVVQAAMSGPYEFAYPGGAFVLENVLVATAATLSFERGMAALIRAGLRVQRKMRRVARQLPLIDAYPQALGGRVAWFEEWLTHPARTDPYWTGLQIPPAAACPVRLVVGPWTHASAFSKALPVVLGEALSWLRAYTGDRQNQDLRNENLPVRVYLDGAGEWLDLADWPPPQAVRRSWYPGAGGDLNPEPPAQPGISSFRYDPADPTPSVGGQLLTGSGPRGQPGPGGPA